MKTMPSMLPILLGALMGVDAFPHKRHSEPVIRKCILPECNERYSGNQIACCREHFHEFKKRKSDTTGG
jgi:hypothetical protein